MIKSIVYLHVEDEEKITKESSSSQKSKESILEEIPEETSSRGDDLMEDHVHKSTDHSQIDRHFNLVKNLEKIHCERYADSLIKEGFGDEVSQQSYSLSQSQFVGFIFISY